ncbi:MAG TPA: hypothetical protein VF702_11340 [Allosphingosinicella sp.]|jgi:hypothetical protein
MLDRLFPARLDNEGYRGSAAALWALGLLLALKAVMGVNGTLNARSVATGADGIRLDGLPGGAAETVLQLFRALSLGQLPLVLIGLAALLRWRAMVPFVYLVLIAEQLARRLLAIAAARPMDWTSPGAWINLGLLALLLAGFALSLWMRPDKDRTAPAG